MTRNISIIGIGRLGICVALCLEKVGYNILGVDTIESYVKQINDKVIESPEPGVSKMLKESKNFKATTNIDDVIKFSDIIFIYVATPSSGGDKHYDHNVLGKVLLSINERKVKNKHIVIGCTVIPGYIQDVGKFLIKDCPGSSLSYNPEFIAQGDIINGIFSADLVLIGQGSPEAGDRLQEIYVKLAVYSEHVPVIHRMSTSSAEITKLSVNSFVTTKIAFANIIGDLADVVTGANKFEILEAIGSDSRIGKKYLTPGFSFGGPCFPRDNRALGGYMQKMGINQGLQITTDILNKLHTEFQIKQIIEGKGGEIDTVIVIGVGYKEKCSVPIIDESAKLKIAEALAKMGIKVIVRDIKTLIDCTKLEYGNLFEYQIVYSLENGEYIDESNNKIYILK